MTQETKSHLPFWESGTGHYGKTLGQSSRLMLNAGHDIALSWFDTVPTNKDGVFTIGDYGTNDGYPSMHLIESMIGSLRKRHGDALPIQIIYEDQEKNDFNSLFNRLCDGTSYMSKFSNVYPFATNVNFYKQCVPDGTCDVIFTSNATQWLETLNTTYKDTVIDTMATKEERARVSVEADRDWTRFLLLRARELKSGGIIIAINLSEVDHAKQEDCTEMAIVHNGKQEAAKPETKTIHDVHLHLDSSWKELKKENIITHEEYEGCKFKLIYRTAKELKSPFEKGTSAVLQAGLTLVHFDQYRSKCAFKTRWQETQKKGTNSAEDNARFADDVVSAHRVWSHSTFHDALSDMRTEEEKAAILDKLYKTCRAHVMTKDPGSYGSEALASIFVARKI